MRDNHRQRPKPAPSLSPTKATLRWAREAIGPGGRIDSVWLLSVSSTTQHALDVTGRSGQHHRLVLRRFHRHQRLAADPWYTPANEAAVLELLAGTHVPAPRLVAADPDATVCDVPVLLTTRRPGSPAQERAGHDRFEAWVEHVLRSC